MFAISSSLTVRCSIQELYDLFWDPQFIPVAGAALTHVNSCQNSNRMQRVEITAVCGGNEFSTLIERCAEAPHSISYVQIRPVLFLSQESGTITFQSALELSYVTLERFLEFDNRALTRFFPLLSLEDAISEALRVVRAADEQFLGFMKSYLDFKLDPVCPV